MDEFLNASQGHSPSSPRLNSSSNADQQKICSFAPNASNSFSQNDEILDFDFPYKLPKLAHSVLAHSIVSLDLVPEFLPTSTSALSVNLPANHKRGQSLNLLTNGKIINNANFNEILVQQQQSSLYMTRPSRSMTTSSLLMPNPNQPVNSSGTLATTAANSANMNSNRSRSKISLSRLLHSIGVNPFYTNNVSKMNTSVSNPSLLLLTASPKALAEGSPLNTPLPTPSQANFNDFSPLSAMFFDEHTNSIIARGNNNHSSNSNRIPKSRSFNHSITTSISSGSTGQHNTLLATPNIGGSSGHRRKRSSIDLQNDHLDLLINFNANNRNSATLLNHNNQSNSILVQLHSQLEDDSVNLTLTDTAALENSTFGFLDELDLGNDTFLLNNKDHEWNRVVNAAAYSTIFSSNGNFNSSMINGDVNNQDSNLGASSSNNISNNNDLQFNNENFNNDIFLKAADITLKMVAQSKPKPTASFADLNDSTNDFKMIIEDIESSSNTTTTATATKFMNGNNLNNSSADFLNGDSQGNNDSMVFNVAHTNTSTPSPTTGIINLSAYNSCSSISSSNSASNTNTNTNKNSNTTLIITSSGKAKTLVKPKTRNMRAKSASGKDSKKNPNILTADEMTPDEVEKAKALLPEGLHESNLIIKKSKRGRSKSSLETSMINNMNVNDNDKSNDKNNNENNDNSKPKKIHECPLCFAVFQRPEHVKRHMRSHSSEKPYQCELCQKRFNRSDNLKAHLRKLHNATT